MPKMRVVKDIGGCWGVELGVRWEKLGVSGVWGEEQGVISSLILCLTDPRIQRFHPVFRVERVKKLVLAMREGIERPWVSVKGDCGQGVVLGKVVDDVHVIILPWEIKWSLHTLCKEIEQTESDRGR